MIKKTNPLNGVVLVTSPQDLAGMVVRKAARMAWQMKVSIVGLVENVAYAVCPSCGERIEVFGPSQAFSTAQQLGVPMLRQLPLDAELARCCAVLAVCSFVDFIKARRSGIGDMALNLPHSLRMRINAVIRRAATPRAFVAGSFFTGVAVSFLELACTGQVYLPTIVFVVSQPEMRVRALLFLVLYNLLFILPLVVVFILAYYGTTSKQLARFLERRGATIKLGMALLFASLAAWLLISVVRG